MIAAFLLLTVIWSDGDSGQLSDGRKFRLAGYDAPETYRPLCEAEEALGEEATLAAKALTEGAEITVSDPVHPPDRWGRIVVHVYADGVSVGEALESVGLAAPWPHNNKGRPMAKKPEWCAG
jgi:micrococcal nuclease